MTRTDIIARLPGIPDICHQFRYVCGENLSCGEISYFYAWQIWRKLKLFHVWGDFKFLHMTDVEKSKIVPHVYDMGNVAVNVQFMLLGSKIRFVAIYALCHKISFVAIYIAEIWILILQRNLPLLVVCFVQSKILFLFWWFILWIILCLCWNFGILQMGCISLEATLLW